MKKLSILFLILILILSVGYLLIFKNSEKENSGKDISELSQIGEIDKIQSSINKKENFHPMSIESLRKRNFEGGQFVMERILENGSNYRQSVVSYQSEGLKIYGLLTVPLVTKPEGGFPAILFVHGYIPPKSYSTTGNYPTYQAALARAGFVTFKPDLRGHGQSEGEPISAHFSEKYVVDVLSALAYLEDYSEVDPKCIGYWGHSNGGEIGLRVAVISNRIKAYSLWAGVVGSFEDMLEKYNAKIPFLRNAGEEELVRQNGRPGQNPLFWDQIDPHSYLKDVSAPIQLQHGTADKSVPVELSVRLREELEKLGKEVEYFEYPGDDHNIGVNSSLAFRRAIEFYNNNL